MVRAREEHSILSMPPRWDTTNSNPNSGRSLASDRSLGSPLSSGQSSPASGRSAQFSSTSDGAPQVLPGRSEWVAEIEQIAFGSPGTLAHRVAFLEPGGKKLISPWRDVPLFGPNGQIFCICKTPAGSWVRYEVADDELFHPLRLVRQGSRFGQCHAGDDSAERLAGKEGDSIGKGQQARPDQGAENGGSSFGKKDASKTPRGWERVRTLLRKSARPMHYVDNAPWNMAMLPQTWSGEREQGSAQYSSPDGTMEVVEVSARRARTPGEVYLVKPLGAFLVEERRGKLAWKIVAIAADDPMAALLRDVGDVLSQLPGMLDVIREWLATCLETPRGVEQGRSRPIKGPYLVSTAQSKVRDHHRAWRHYRDAQLEKGEAGDMQGAPEAFTASSLEKAWGRYTAQDSQSLLGSIPLCCPASESCMLFEADWLEAGPEAGPEAEHEPPAAAAVQSQQEAVPAFEPEKFQRQASWDARVPVREASLASPDSVLPVRGALVRTGSMRLKSPQGDAPASQGRRGLSTLFGSSPRGSPEHSASREGRSLSQPSTPALTSPNHPLQGSGSSPKESSKSRPMLGSFRLGSHSSKSQSKSSSKSKAPTEVGKPASLGMMALKRMSGPPGLSHGAAKPAGTS